MQGALLSVLILAAHAALALVRAFLVLRLVKKKSEVPLIGNGVFELKERDDRMLVQTIEAVLRSLEDAGDLVICSETPSKTANVIANAVGQVVPSTGLTFVEMVGVRSLILEAISHRSFFDREMPTLTGFSSEEFRTIAEKLPRE